MDHRTMKASVDAELKEAGQAVLSEGAGAMGGK
jgi:hypothetical protein